MSRFEWKTINGKMVLKQDFSKLLGCEVLVALEESHQQIISKGRHGIIVLTNIQDLKFDHHVTKAFEELSLQNKPFVKASAVYGAGTLQKVAIESVGRMTERQFNVFKDEDEAQEWVNTL